jgi:pSer/pThr/pTyr-binding forkhead associated (FHA) protein
MLAPSSHPRVICGTCGCDNPGQLVFCQECGQRLGPRVAPPTPPIGVGAGMGAGAASKSVCGRCAAENQPGVRYCATCGNVLGPPQPAAEPAAPAIPKIDPAPAVPKVSPPAAAAGPAIVPAPVYQMPSAPLAAQAAAIATGTRVCPRCRGASDDLAQFCRFCGAGLASGAAPARPEALPNDAVARALPSVTDPHVAAFWRPPVPVGFPSPGQSPPVLVTSVAIEPAAAPTKAAAVMPPVPGRPAIPSIAAADAAQAQRTARPIAVPTYGRIVIITKEGAEGASYPLHDQVDIGRLEGEVVLGDDRYLSPRHARIVRRVETGKPPEIVLVDLASTNGIYSRLGGEGSREVTLEDQDLFLVGQQVLKFEIVRDAEEGLAPATQHGTLVFGTPTVPRYARLSQRTVEGVTRDVFHLQKAETILGRESGDIVFTDDPFLSRRHAAIKFDQERRRFVLSDLGSSNGTFVQIRGQVTIKSGDQFRIGQQLFRVDLSAASAP